MGREELHNTLRVRRATLGITQEELASAVGVTRKTINTIERGIYTPSTALSLRLARHFGVPVETLFQLPDPESAPTPGPAL